MKKIFIFFYILCVYVNAQSFKVETIINNGTNKNNINLVILGDGYTAEEQGIFLAKAKEVGTYILEKKPFSYYKNYINVHAIKVISNESGVKHPGTATDVEEPVIPISNPDNYLGSSFDIGSTHRCIFSNNINRVNYVLSRNFPSYDMALIIVNSNEDGGCGGQFAFLSADEEAKEVAVHELGHSFAKLADEYWFAGTGESLNKTRYSNPQYIKWKNWLGTDGVGIYPYEEDTSWFRPHQNCEMRYLDSEFCKVCSEAIVEKIHSLSSPINSYTPTSRFITSNNDNNINFNVKLKLPEPNYLKGKWILNGEEVSSNLNSFTLLNSKLNEGINQLNYSVVDATPNVRVNNHERTHVSTVIWRIIKNNSETTNIDSKEIQFTLYPNPTSNFIYIKDIDNNLGNLKAEVYDLNGKLLLKQNIRPSNNYRINLERLQPKIYILNVYKDDVLILKQNIVKK